MASETCRLPTLNSSAAAAAAASAVGRVRSRPLAMSVAPLPLSGATYVPRHQPASLLDASDSSSTAAAAVAASRASRVEVHSVTPAVRTISQPQSQPSPVLSRTAARIAATTSSSSSSGGGGIGSPGILRRCVGVYNGSSSNSGDGDTRRSMSVTFDESLSYRLDLADVLARFDDGDTVAYNELCMELSKGMLSCRMLADTLLDVAGHAASLCYTRHQSLIRACLASNWHHLADQHVDRYFSLVVAVATTQPHCVADAIKVLIHALMYVDSDTVGTFDGHLTDRELHFHQLTIEAILAILRVIPMASETVVNTLIGRVPYIKRSVRLQAACVSSMLQLAQQLPAHSSRLLLAVFQRLIQVDTQCSREQICATLSQEPSSSSASSAAALAADTTNSVSGGSVCADSGQQTHQFYIHLMDSLMYTVLRFMHTLCYKTPPQPPAAATTDDDAAAAGDGGHQQQQQKVVNGVEQQQQMGVDDGETSADQQLCLPTAKKLYTQLLQVFDQLILCTPATCHVQFTVLWLAGRRCLFTEHLVDWLWRRVIDMPATARSAGGGGGAGTRVTQPQRCAAALYLGSLLARARYATIELVRVTLEVMCGWLHRYLDKVDAAAAATDSAAGVFGATSGGQYDTNISSSDHHHHHWSAASAGHALNSIPLYVTHRVFHAVCQTVFYVVAFRHSDMTPIADFLPSLRSLNLGRLVLSTLNPLNHCLPPVVRRFSAVARHYQLAYCSTIIARNRRERIPVVFHTSLGLRRKLHEGVQTTFFPFDPYLLPQSAAFIKGIYRDYTGDNDVLADDEDDEDDDDDYELVDEDDGDVMGCGRHAGDEDGCFDMVALSVSP